MKTTTPEKWNPTPQEIENRSKWISRMESSLRQRQATYDEFDGMTYEDYFFSNLKNRNAYLEPKVNKEDVRIVSGITQEKVHTMHSALMNYNFEPQILAFDEESYIDVEVGNVCEKLIEKSRKIEPIRHEEKQGLYVLEFLTQGNVFVEEQWLEYQTKKKELSKELDWSEDVDPNKIKWEERLGEVCKVCNSELVTGLDLYAGNIRQFHMSLQPFIFIRKKITRQEAGARFQKWARWKYVPTEVTYTVSPDSGNQTDTISYNDWTLVEHEIDMVEVIVCQDKWENELQIFCNGIPMLPDGFPLSFLLGVSEYTVAKGNCEPISDRFFYAKGLSAKTKIDEALFNEFLKMMIVKTRKSFKPTIIDNSGSKIGADIHLPGKIFRNVNYTKIHEFGKTDGVNAAEFNMVQFVKNMIDNKTVSPVFEGQSVEKAQTAREVVELKEQTLMKLGYSLMGWMQFEINLAWLRLHNIFSHWTEPEVKEIVDGVEVKKYKKYSTETDFDGEERGDLVVEFTDEKELPDSDQMYAREEIIKKKTGRAVRIKKVNTAWFKGFRDRFYIEMTPQEKAGGELKSVLFEESLIKAANLFGVESINQDYAKQRWATLKQEDPEKLFNKTPTIAPGVPSPAEGQTPVGGLGSQLGVQPTNKPTINAVV